MPIHHPHTSAPPARCPCYLVTLVSEEQPDTADVDEDHSGNVEQVPLTMLMSTSSSKHKGHFRGGHYLKNSKQTKARQEREAAGTCKMTTFFPRSKKADNDAGADDTDSDTDADSGAGTDDTDNDDDTECGGSGTDGKCVVYMARPRDSITHQWELNIIQERIDSIVSRIDGSEPLVHLALALNFFLFLFRKVYAYAYKIKDSC
jgi:hypothetical protein